MKLKNVIIPALLIFCLISLISASVWTSYGSGFIPMWHWNTDSDYGRFDLGYSKSSITTGLKLGSVPSYPFTYTNYDYKYSVNPEPLIWNFDTGTSYMIVPSGSYLQVYNKNLYLIEEISTGQVTSQIDLVDFSDAGNLNEVAGVFEYNDTLLQFKTYKYNESIAEFSKTYEYNLSVDSNYFVNGLRCQTGECYFAVYENSTKNTRFYWANTTSLNSLTLTGFLAPIEPVAWFDIDNDGQNEFMLYNNQSIKVFEKDGTIDVSLTPTGANQFHQAIMFYNDATNDFRYATIEGTTSGSFFPSLYAYVYKADGNLMWNDLLANQTYPTNTGASSYWVTGRIAVVDDYGGFGNDDGYADVYAVGLKNLRSSANPNNWYVLRVYQGYTGDKLFQFIKSFQEPSGTDARENIALTLADMNDNGYDDFIIKTGVNDSSNGELRVVDGFSAGDIVNASIKYSSGCVPADLNFDSFLDIICSGTGGTSFLSSGGTNTNSQIVSVAYSPSLSVQVGEPLFALVTATDNDADTIYYREKCSNSEAWSSPDTNSTRQCIYGSVGTYNMSVGVKDLFHSTYDIFSQEIIVTETGTICDNDGICEASQGETYFNCGDCSAPNTTTSSVEGSMTLPTELVDTTNTNQGILPEIYYGTLGFFSSILSPLIVLVFVILFVMIMITIGIIVKRIAIRVGNGRSNTT